jgi:uncharacterized protein (TIGR00255 family)
MKSMTGYGEASQEHKHVKITVQIRSLNHRHLDLQLRAPREFLGFEEDIRKRLRETISRGRIDVFINRSSTPRQTRTVELDEELLGEYLKAIQYAQKKFRLSGEMGIGILSSVPDLLRVRDLEVDVSLEKQALFAALNSAVQNLERSRLREGRQLKNDIMSQVRFLKTIAMRLEKQAQEILLVSPKPAAFPKNGEAAASRINSDRSDVSSWVMKGDINEEIVRLKSHLAALQNVIGEKVPVGKKIDFMLQEIQRELNTISSKVALLPVVQLVLQGKERVEKIREQTQNVE